MTRRTCFGSVASLVFNAETSFSTSQPAFASNRWVKPSVVSWSSRAKAKWVGVICVFFLSSAMSDAYRRGKGGSGKW